MKKIIFLVCFCLSSIINCLSQISILDKNEAFVSPQQDMIVMDKYTFAKYHYISEQYDSLKKEVSGYDSTVEWLNDENHLLEQDFKNLVALKDKQIEDYASGYASLKNALAQSIEEQNKLQAAYVKSVQKQKRVKKWRNIFLGTTAVLGGVITLIIVH